MNKTDAQLRDTAIALIQAYQRETFERTGAVMDERLSMVHVIERLLQRIDELEQEKT